MDLLYELSYKDKDSDSSSKLPVDIGREMTETRELISVSTKDISSVDISREMVEITDIRIRKIKFKIEEIVDYKSVYIPSLSIPELRLDTWLSIPESYKSVYIPSLSIPELRLDTWLSVLELYKSISISWPSIKDRTMADWIFQKEDIKLSIPIEISTEIKEMNNIWINKVLKNALMEIIPLIYKDNYKIKVRIKEDIEFPKWKEIVIEILIKDLHYDKLIESWSIIEKKVRKRIETIKLENKEEIEKINENLAIFIDELTNEL